MTFQSNLTNLGISPLSGTVLAKHLVKYVAKYMAECNFGSNVNQTQNCEFQKPFANCGVNPKHCIIISTLLISPNLYLKLESCF